MNIGMGGRLIAVLLAGGRSRRMMQGHESGAGKLDMEISGRRLGRLAADNLLKAFDKVYVCSQKGNVPPSLRDLPIIHDLPAGAGPAAGIASAVAHAEGWCFVVAADMPFLDHSMISAMRDIVEGLPEEYLCAIPTWHMGNEPLHAFYRCEALIGIVKFMKSGGRSLNEMIAQIHPCYLDAEKIAEVIGSSLERAFFNVNTKEDLEQARRIANTAVEQTAAKE
jgi:molybdopterin-guanine dinucleotide biosynthesis protein A